MVLLYMCFSLNKETSYFYPDLLPRFCSLEEREKNPSFLHIACVIREIATSCCSIVPQKIHSTAALWMETTKKPSHFYPQWLNLVAKNRNSLPLTFYRYKIFGTALGLNLSYCSRLWFAKIFWFNMNALGVGANHTAFHFWETTEKTQTRVSKTDCMPLSGSYFVWENSPFYPEILGLSFFREKAFC